MSFRHHEAILLQVIPLTKDTVMYLFAGKEKLQFRPGQFISIRVGMDEQNNPILRSYSIASQPDELVFSIVIKLLGDGLGTCFFKGLKRGDTVQFTGPMGFFVNELFHSGDVIYAATGTGIAPIYPMLYEILQRQELGNIYLYWGIRDETDLFWQEELALLQSSYNKLQVFVYLSKPLQKGYKYQGRIIQPILEKISYLKKPVFYLCGNGKMIDELKQKLQNLGVDRKRQIRTESFFD